MIFWSWWVVFIMYNVLFLCQEKLSIGEYKYMIVMTYVFRTRLSCLATGRSLSRRSRPSGRPGATKGPPPSLATTTGSAGPTTGRERSNGCRAASGSRTSTSSKHPSRDQGHDSYSSVWCQIDGLCYVEICDCCRPSPVSFKSPLKHATSNHELKRLNFSVVDLSCAPFLA